MSWRLWFWLSWVRARPWMNGGLAAGVVMFLVGAAFHVVLVPIVAPGIPSQFEQNPALYRPWNGWTGTYMVLHPFGYGFVFAAGFLALRCWAGFPAGTLAGLAYGGGVFVVGSLPVYLLAFAAVQIPPEVLVSWVLQSLAQYTLAGMAIGCVIDGAAVRVSSRLPASASRVWELLSRKDTFLYITRGMATFADAESWPERLLDEGTKLTTRVRLFGWGPSSAHEVEVVRVNAARRVVETRESGALVRTWNHTMTVDPISDTECWYTDQVELHAGLLTPLVWLFAAMFYRHRHRRWRTWLASAQAAT